MGALQLHAVAPADGTHAVGALPVGARSVAVRDLIALVSHREEFAPPPVTPDSIEAHRNVIDTAFRQGTVLPAPVGVVFRSEDALTQWMDLHYVALSDALTYVEDRVGARVHICRGAACDPKEEIGADVAAAAAGALRDIRRRALATIPLRTEHFTGIIVSSAYLVERALWKDFQSAVDEVRTSNTDFSVKVSGPWAPYDFVKMQFGA